MQMYYFRAVLLYCAFAFGFGGIPEEISPVKVSLSNFCLLCNMGRCDAKGV